MKLPKAFAFSDTQDRGNLCNYSPKNLTNERRKYIERRSSHLFSLYQKVMRMLKLFLMLSFFILIMSEYGFAQEFVTNGLISYWTFDKTDMDGETVKDIWGQNNGNTKGKPLSVAGKIEEALSFDGVKDMVEVPINDDLSRIGTDSMTIEAWINAEGPCHGVICGRDYWILHWSSCAPPPVGMIFYVGCGGRRSVSSKTFVKKDEWHHWAGVYDGKALKIYTDGQMDGSVALSGEIGGTGDGHSEWIVFGKDYHDTADRWNKVLIDEVRIYNRALSDDEIMRNFSVNKNKLAVNPAGKLATNWGVIKN